MPSGAYKRRRTSPEIRRQPIGGNRSTPIVAKFFPITIGNEKENEATLRWFQGSGGAVSSRKGPNRRNTHKSAIHPFNVTQGHSIYPCRVFQERLLTRPCQHRLNQYDFVRNRQAETDVYSLEDTFRLLLSADNFAPVAQGEGIRLRDGDKLEIIRRFFCGLL